MTDVVVKYRLNEEAQSKAAVVSGVAPGREHIYTYPFADLNIPQREAVVRVGTLVDGDYTIDLRNKLKFVPRTYYAAVPRPSFWLDEEPYEFSEFPTINELITFSEVFVLENAAKKTLATLECDKQIASKKLKDALEKLETQRKFNAWLQTYVQLKPVIEELIENAETIDDLAFDWRQYPDYNMNFPTIGAEYSALWRQHAELGEPKSLANLLHDKRKEFKKIAEDKVKQERLAYKTNFINTNGSQYLKTAFERGYDAGRQYELELTKHLFGPGVVLDYNETAETKDRSMPSAEALKVCDRLTKTPDTEVEIVWLTKRPTFKVETEAYEEYDYYFEQGEAIRINHKQLSRYAYYIID